MSILLLTVMLAAFCGVLQVAILGSVSVLVPLGVVLGAAYLFLVLGRSMAALVSFVLVFAEFLGLLPEASEVNSVKLIDIVTAMLVIPLFVHLMKEGFPFHGTVGRHLRLGAVILLVLITGQIFLTTLSTDQSFWLSVKAAKPYLYYFGFLVVPVYAGSPKQVRQLASWMTLIASGLSLMYLLISLVGELGYLPALIVGEANYVGLGTFTRVRSNGAPLIVAMLLYQFYRYVDGKSSGLEKLSLILLAMGTTVHFYRSLWVGILVGIVVQASIEGKRGARSVAKFLLFLVVLATAISVIHPEYGEMIASRALSTVTEVEQLNGSYGARQEQIERWAPILRDHWLLGIGFLHHDSAVGQQMEALYQLEGTGNYDVGWVDLLGRLGVLGIAFLTAALYLLTKGSWHSHLYEAGGDLAVLSRTLIAYLVAGVVSLPGYPILSCGAGIIPMVLLVGMLSVLRQAEEEPFQESTGPRGGNVSLASSGAVVRQAGGGYC
jgi:hypothetical protein